MRIDLFLTNHLQFSSRSILKKKIKSILVHQKEVKFSYLCKEGDPIEVLYFKEPSTTKKLLYPNFLDKVYEDDTFIVVHKKKEEIVYPNTPGKKTYSGYMQDYLKEKVSLFPDPLRAGIVHRLDRPTEGLLILAKDPNTQIYFHELFKDRKIEKEYCAILKGPLFQSHGTINQPITRTNKFYKRKVAIHGEVAQEAITEYEVLERNDQLSLVKVFLHTGRTHQIRLHFHFLGFPILGDTLYDRNMTQEKRLYLFAQKLAFPHPHTKENMVFCLDLPPSFKQRMNFE